MTCTHSLWLILNVLTNWNEQMEFPINILLHVIRSSFPFYFLTKCHTMLLHVQYVMDVEWHQLDSWFKPKLNHKLICVHKLDIFLGLKIWLPQITLPLFHNWNFSWWTAEPSLYTLRLLFHYHPQWQLQGGNVFTSVCLSTGWVRYAWPPVPSRGWVCQVHPQYTPWEGTPLGM